MKQNNRNKQNRKNCQNLIKLIRLCYFGWFLTLCYFALICLLNFTGWRVGLAFCLWWCFRVRFSLAFTVICYKTHFSIWNLNVAAPLLYVPPLPSWIFLKQKMSPRFDWTHVSPFYIILTHFRDNKNWGRGLLVDLVLKK